MYFSLRESFTNSIGQVLPTVSNESMFDLLAALVRFLPAVIDRFRFYLSATFF